MDDLQRRFEYHPPLTEERKHLNARARAMVGDVANDLDELLPDGREKSLVITHLEEAMFWANAAIARQED